MPTFQLTVANAMTLDGRVFNNTATQTLYANQCFTQTLDVTSTYTDAGLVGARFAVVINKGSEDVLMRLAFSGMDYIFFNLPPGAHAVLPEFYSNGSVTKRGTLALRAETTSSRVFLIVGR